jgi:site-specific DNA-methyltransferase (adenine-specific)
VIGNATLYHGDAREVLPTLQADVVMTDPVWPNCPKDLIPGSDDPYGLFLSACAALPEVKRMVVVMRHDSDPRFLLPVPLPYVRAAWLPYVMPGYIGRMLGGDEIAYCFGTPIPSRPGQRVIPGRAEPEQPAGRKANGHPCARAIGHFKWLTRWWSEEGETILDPFMGSGTTGEAAVTGGRKFIGIEIDKKYFDLACKRIDRALDQQRLFA